MTEHDNEGGTAVAEEQPGHEETHSDPPFNNKELARFEEDDTIAGAHIGKMLAVLFFYTVVAMGLVSLWTVWSVANQ